MKKLRKKLTRWILLGAAAAALWSLPFRATDAAKLLPVKTVVVAKTESGYTVDVGAGVKAAGKTLSAALELLRERVSGTAFFRTAEQIILNPAAAAEGLEEITNEPEFRPAAGLYVTTDPDPDARGIARYLSAHPADTTILRVRADLKAGAEPKLPVLRAEGGGYRVYRPESVE